MTERQHKSAGQCFEQRVNAGGLIPFRQQAVGDRDSRIEALSECISIEQNAAVTQHMLAALRQLRWLIPGGEAVADGGRIAAGRGIAQSLPTQWAAMRKQSRHPFQQTIGGRTKIAK